MALQYDSSSVDGRTSGTNAQASWIGEGWDYSPGFVELSYESCSLDGLTSSADECWAGYHATLSLAGHSSPLVRDDTSHTWRLQNDDGSTVEFLSGDSNGTNNGEYVRLTDPSGVQYYFGLDHLPGGDGTDPSTNAAWRVPVYSPNSKDPCYSASQGAASWCYLPWRLNLSYVVDTHGNLTTYTYTPETNYYNRGAGQNNGSGSMTAYTRGGALATISYGQTLAGQIAAKGKANAAARVVFKPAPEGRCSTDGGYVCSNATLSSTNAAHWPDVPYDQNCGATGSCSNYAPTYWINDRLSAILTQVLSSGAYRTVDEYDLAQYWPKPKDATSTPTMALSSVQRKGEDGTEAPLPPVSFVYAELPNRVDGTTLVPAPSLFFRPRLQQITTETGERINVDYNLPDCSRTGNVMPTSADTDVRTCYNVKWYIPGSVADADPTSDWFLRYTVKDVTANDLVTDSPQEITNYSYGPAAWHYNDDETIDPKTRTWDQFRGFATVTTITGSGQDGPQTKSETRYFQGMDGDANASGGTKSVSQSNSLGSYTDSDWLSGQLMESDTYAGAATDATITAYSVTDPTNPSTTATQKRTSNLPDQVARYGSTKTIATSRALKADGTWRTTTQTTTTDPANANRIVSVDTTADGLPETCVLIGYATSSNALITALADEQKTISGSCSTVPNSSNTLKGTRTLYDGKPFGQAAGSGDATAAQVLDHFDTSGNPVFTMTGTSAYDSLGRLTTLTDPNTTDAQHPNGKVTSTAYNSSTSGELPTSVTVATSAPGTSVNWTTTTTLDQARALPLVTTDPNGNATTEKYDALGRLTAVWKPGRATTKSANLTYSYAVNGAAAPSAITASSLSNDGEGYMPTVQIFDGLGHVRQVQATSTDSSFTGRLISDTLYDSLGRAVETRNPWYDGSSKPSTTLYSTTDDKVPGQTITTYDGQGRPAASIFDSYGLEQWRTTTAYPGADETDITPATGATPTTTISDALGRTIQTWQYRTTTATGHPADADVATASYTPLGQVASRTDATGKNTWTYSYDLQGRQTSASDPDTGTSTTTYTADGQVASTTDARKQTLTYSYDLLGRKTAEYSGSTAAPANELVAWTYDTVTGGKGQPASTTRYVNGASGSAYVTQIGGYDAAYHATSVITTIPAAEEKLAGSYTYKYAYDPITGALNTAVYPTMGDIPAEAVTYSYDVNGAMLTFGSGTTYDLSTDYDPFGRPIRTTVNLWGTEIVATDNYDEPTGRLLSTGSTSRPRATAPPSRPPTHTARPARRQLSRTSPTTLRAPPTFSASATTTSDVSAPRGRTTGDSRPSRSRQSRAWAVAPTAPRHPAPPGAPRPRSVVQPRTGPATDTT